MTQVVKTGLWPKAFGDGSAGYSAKPVYIESGYYWPNLYSRDHVTDKHPHFELRLNPAEQPRADAVVPQGGEAESDTPF